MTRNDILQAAAKAVCSDRNQQYGEPEDNFKAIARLWSAYLGIHISPLMAAAMMILFKVGRIETSPSPTDDTFVDIAGYAACGGEIAGGNNER